MAKVVAISACLLGEVCRYDGTDNLNEALLNRLQKEGATLVGFCPEDDAYGTPRPTMDLVQTPQGVRAISNTTGEDLSAPIEAYAKAFFDAHPEVTLFIGKDRSPSCGVCSAKCYDGAKMLISTSATGLMAQEAKHRGIEAVDAETYLAKADV